MLIQVPSKLFKVDILHLRIKVMPLLLKLIKVMPLTYYIFDYCF